MPPHWPTSHASPWRNVAISTDAGTGPTNDGHFCPDAVSDVDPTTPRGLVDRQGLAALTSSAVSSATNAAMTLGAAALLTTRDFGAFSLVVMVALLAANITNGFTGEVRLSLPATLGTGGRDITREVLGTSVFVSTALGVLSALVAAVVAATWLGGLDWAVVAGLGVSIPATSIHATARSVAFATREADVALRLDLGWALVVVTGLAIAFTFEVAATSLGMVAVWSAGAGGALAASKYRPAIAASKPIDARSWLADHWRLGASLAYNTGIAQATLQAVALAVGALVGLAALGGLRLAQTLLGVATVVFSAARARLLPSLVDLPAARMTRVLLITSMGLALVPALTMVGLVAGTDLLSSALGAQTWTTARSVLLPTTVLFVGSAMSQGPMMGLRVGGAARSIVAGRTFGAMAATACGLAGVLRGGLEGAAWGLAAGLATGAAVWWWLYLRQSGTENDQ